MDNVKKRGRKAGVGTLEARQYVNNDTFRLLLSTDKGLSDEALERLMRAVKFGLGMK